MKKILVTGKNSYIGTSFEKWLAKNPDEYQVDTVGTRNAEWKDFDFSSYDVVFHVAGIAHIKETKKNEHLYYEVNRDLAYEIAKKAREQGIKHFIFLSTMSVYGLNEGIIDDNTPLNPRNAYGKSKLEAEKLISGLETTEFKLAIVRPPMIYGKDCKGNYTLLSKVAKKVSFFPFYLNERSMLYIENHSEFIKKLIDTQAFGVFKPQNTEFVNTSHLVKCISLNNNSNIIMTKLFNPLIKILKIKVINKVFGSLVYDKAISEYNFQYNVVDFDESIRLTESKV